LLFRLSLLSTLLLLAGVVEARMPAVLRMLEAVVAVVDLGQEQTQLYL
jgi:hypothetical protein